MALQAFLAGFHIGAATGWDLFIILIFLIAVFVYGFFMGRNRMVVLLLSSYFSWAIMRVIPWPRLTSLAWLGIGERPSASLQILIFAGLVLLFYFLIPRSILSSTLRVRKRGEASWLQLFLISIVQIGLVIAVILSFLPSDAVSTLMPLVQKMFVGTEAQFIWITLPILVLVLTKRKKKEDNK